MLLADFAERAGRSGVVFMMKMDGPRPSLESRWVLFSGGKHEGYPSLDECVLDGLAKLGW